MRRHALLAAITVGIAAFLLYRATLLPGMDLGDTPSLQTRIGSSLITPRDGYPLYTAIGNLFHWALPGNPARALNVASAVQAALACAVIVPVGATLSGSVAAGAAAALLFATSYTFWSQSIIAEVYALHIVFVALTVLLVLRWAERPSLGRLAAFFAAYAIGFGNHLSMILLAPAFALFLLATAPNGWRSLITTRVLALAFVCACAGALQYAWNLSALWMLPNPPDGLADGLRRFWFDVTKADWRETMVMQVPRAMAADHAAMYAFDLRQQFGWAGALIALAGISRLVTTNRRHAALVLTIYVVNVVFALGYNVGDTHVFYLPSHLIVALLAAPGIVLVGNVLRQRHLVVALLLVAYAGTRAWRDYPALDRSHDDRPSRVLADLTAGLDDRDAILLTDLNWQVQNGLSYFGKSIAPQVAYERMPAVLLYAPALIADNTAIGRDVVLTERARSTLMAAYGPLIPSERDPRVPTPSLSDATRNLPPGSRYVFCILKPTRDLALDWDDIGDALTALAGGPVHVPDGDYVVVAGRLGQPPDLLFGSNRPFRRWLDLAGVPVSIRMESWLSADTIRRMGFGHVIADRRHTLIVERGVSFAAFGSSGEALRTAYASNIFGPQPRYIVKR